MLKGISNLPDPRHVLSSKIIPSTIATANTEVVHVCMCIQASSSQQLTDKRVTLHTVNTIESDLRFIWKLIIYL